MAERQWHVGRGNTPEGPYSDAQLRDLIASGRVTADTLVWSAGMAAWTKAADIPGLMQPPRMPPPLGTPPLPPMPASGTAIAPGGRATGALALNVGVWELFWRWFVYGLAKLSVIPLPFWAPVVFGWTVEHVELPGHQRVGFAGQPGDIWWAFILFALCDLLGIAHSGLYLIGLPLSILFGLLIARWFVANLTWDGQTAALQFTAGYWKLLGWYLFFILAILSIVGWAWVATATIRWLCRHVVGSTRELVFNGSGWGFLWRSLVVAITAIVLIPIPWTTRWFSRWLVSELALVERA